MTYYNDITIRQSGQGLLTVDLNGKPSDWKISNSGGVWNLYKVLPYKKLPTNLASIIHKPELTAVVGKLINDDISS